MKHALLVATLMLPAACMVGTPAHKFQPAIDPRGVSADLTLADNLSLDGELLAVDDTSLVIRRPATAVIAVVRFAALRSGRFRQVGAVYFGFQAPAAGAREGLRRASRFPQGLSPELLRRLLQAHAQADVVLY